MDNLFIIVAVIFSSTILLFPGPITTLFFVSAVKKKRLSYTHLYLFLVVYGLTLFLIIITSVFKADDLFSCLTPIAIATSLGILGSSWKTLLQIGEEDREFQKRIDVGVFLIIFLQVLIFVIIEGINAR